MSQNIKIKDQMKREVIIPAFPLRMISLVPSQTELLYDLGLEERVVGVTKFCIHPIEWNRNKKRVGGTKKVDFEKIALLEPDLIIGNKEENEKSDIELLEKQFPVWMSDIKTFDDALDMIHQISVITNKETGGNQMVDRIMKAKESYNSIGKNEKVLYFIWKNPWMAVGRDTFIDEMLRLSGKRNAIEDKRYVALSEEQIKALNPEVIYLSSEPYPFKTKHFDELKTILPNVEIKIVDGEMFSWYGSRMEKAFAYFSELNSSS